MTDVATTSPAMIRLAEAVGHLLKDCLDRADEEVEAVAEAVELLGPRFTTTPTSA